MADINTQLSEARAALHNLLTGKQVVRIEHNGKEVEFTKANRADLERYITQLQAQAIGSRRRPLGVCL